LELTVVVREEDDGYWSEVKELPGCFASARSLEELADAVAEAIGLYLWEHPADLGNQVLRVGEVPIDAEPRRGGGADASRG
jgi:predicted RNase H-like HicB family nuclease